MGIIVNKSNDQNSDLKRRIDADLRAKLHQTSKSSSDFIDIEYSKDSKKTGRFSWAWAILIILALISLVFILKF